MRVCFLGTAASEGYPDAFCACENCKRARTAAGASLRKRSSALIDDCLLIDLGPDLMAASLMHDVPLTALRYCVQTHEHADHFDPSHLLSRSPGCKVHDAPHLHLYATHGALRKAASTFGGRLPADGLLDPAVSERLNLTAHVIAPFQTFTMGPYRVQSVRAAHDPAIVPLLHVIEREGRSLFYATDTGPLPEETWDALRAAGHRFNLVILDHTFGMRARATAHLNRRVYSFSHRRPSAVSGSDG